MLALFLNETLLKLPGSSERARAAVLDFLGVSQDAVAAAVATAQARAQERAAQRAAQRAFCEWRSATRLQREVRRRAAAARSSEEDTLKAALAGGHSAAAPWECFATAAMRALGCGPPAAPPPPAALRTASQPTAAC